MKLFGCHSRGLAVVLVVGVFASPGLAQDVVVRSGEHDGFSRLVLEIGADRSWTLQSEENAAQVSFDPPIDGFDLDPVFQRIPPDRLRAIRQEDGLALDLGCACEVRTERYQDRFLVIDIADSTEQVAAIPPEPERDAVPEPNPLPDLAELLRDRPAPLDFAAVPNATPPATAPPTSEGTDIDIEDAARIMAEQLARAAASGLLEAAPDRTFTDADPVAANEDPASRSPETEPQVAESVVSEDTNASPEPAPLVAETALDAALPRLAGAAALQDHIDCDPSTLDPSTWAAGASVDEPLGRLRAAAFDARGQVDEGAVLHLAHHYLAFGFGAEARFWLTQLPDPPTGLLAIALIVDGTLGRHSDAVPNAMLCGDTGRFWRYLDGAEQAPLSDDALGQVQRVASALPPVLRDSLGPRLARQLVSDGHDTAARTIRDMLVRGGRLSETDLLHLDLDLGIHPTTGDGDMRQDLAVALQSPGADAPSALAHAIRYDRLSGLPPSPARTTAAEAALREFGIGPQTAALWHEVLLAHAASGGIDHAIAMMAGARGAEVPWQDAMTGLVADRWQARDTMALMLLAHQLGADWRAGGSEAGQARVGAMAHLRAAGLPAAAEALRGGERMLILPARPAVPPTENDALRTAWHAADWLQLEGIAAEPHAGLAAHMRQIETAEGETPEVDLDTLSATVDSSADLRAMLANLITDPAPRLRGEVTE